ncbi:MAG: 7-carboxy-7-deazaguanine synthase [Rhodothermales bacterium]|nr:7-carboxy-7-deazaguanine synthase [Rhodothermales bacterium]
MMYSIKETYYTIQGEGHHTGRPAVFLRFAGCNLWTGREEDRANATCRFCDTEFFGVDGPGGGKFTSASDLASHVSTYWPDSEDDKFVVCTGGEPALQMDTELVRCLQGSGFTVAIETNGTLQIPGSIDWVCVSPKANTDVVLRSGNELKVVVPQDGIVPDMFADWDFDHFYIQPMDSPERDQNTASALEYCMTHPKWKLSLQMHKFLGIP